MSMLCGIVFVGLLSVFTGCCYVKAEFNFTNVIGTTFHDCAISNDTSSCISNKFSGALERSMEWNVYLLKGISLLRNNEEYTNRAPRFIAGRDRLKQAIINFLKTHTLSVELSTSRELKSGDSGGGLFKRKQFKKEKKYLQYVFMVLLGIFGLTAPLVMKVLGLIAANALLSAKAALIIVGSVALKKIFDKDHKEPSVKVHTIKSDQDYDTDRYDRFGPYYGYYDNNWKLHDRAYNNDYLDYVKNDADIVNYKTA